MPIYVYKHGDDEIERFFHRDAPESVRHDGEIYVRSHFARVALVGLKPEPSMGDEILRGYREQEILKGSRFHSKLDAETIKSVWKNDRPDPADTGQIVTATKQEA